jgi:hypothetical protein
MLLYLLYFYLTGVSINIIWTIYITIKTYGNKDGFTTLQTITLMSIVIATSWVWVYISIKDFIIKRRKKCEKD